jgi:hypothetical protein
MKYLALIYQDESASQKVPKSELEKFVLYAAIVILTLAYFVPRDLILFTRSIPDHLKQIRAAWAQWSRMNWLRPLLGLTGVLCSFKGLDACFNTNDPRQGIT